jgi:cytochrome c553
MAGTPLDDELSQAMALEGDATKGREIFSICSAFPTTEGWGTNNGRYPQLAAQHSSVLIKQLSDVRAGKRGNPEMHPLAMYDEISGPQAIANVVAYINTLPMSPETGKGTAGDRERAERLFYTKCSGCHGVNGEGDEEKFYPRIHGQHYEYLLRQLKWIQAGKRLNANKTMMRKIKRLKLEDLELLADYVSKLSPPAEMMAEPGWKNPDFWSN